LGTVSGLILRMRAEDVGFAEDADCPEAGLNADSLTGLDACSCFFMGFAHNGHQTTLHRHFVGLMTNQ